MRFGAWEPIRRGASSESSCWNNQLFRQQCGDYTSDESASLSHRGWVFSFYSLLGFCFICVPVEVIGSALDINFENLIITMLFLTAYSAALLRLYTREVVSEEVKRQRRIIPPNQWREFQESMKWCPTKNKVLQISGIENPVGDAVSLDKTANA